MSLDDRQRRVVARIARNAEHLRNLAHNDAVALISVARKIMLDYPTDAAIVRAVASNVKDTFARLWGDSQTLRAITDNSGDEDCEDTWPGVSAKHPVTVELTEEEATWILRRPVSPQTTLRALIREAMARSAGRRNSP